MTARLNQYENHLDPNEPRWFAVYTRYNREKLVTKKLNERGINAYLPLQSITKTYTRKVHRVQKPLINCYVFTKITKASYIPVLETPDVVQFVKFSKNLIAIPEQEIEIMRRVTGEQLDIEVEEHAKYNIGDEVEIISGNLTGLRGKLLNTGNKKFLINLKHAGFALRIEIPSRLLRKIY